MTKQIPPGYKQTKVGIIPEDWEVVRIGDILKIGSGKDYKHLNAGSIPVYGTGGYMLSVDNYLYHGESVCIGRKGTIDKPIFLNGKFWTVDTLFYTYSFKKSLPIYVYSIFLRIDWKKYNEASGVPSLSKTTIESIQIPLPPLKEQEKIAEILSTWDEVIAKQEQFIEQKQVFKKGIMQQIFSQKIRFKDDNGNDYPAWKTKKLGDIAKISTGSSNREDSTEEDGKYTFFDRSQDIRTSNIYLFDCEAVIVAGEGQEFIPKYFIGKFDLHQRTYAIYDFINASGLFIYYYLHQNKNYFISQSVGSTVKSLRLPMFIKMSINLPTLEEQTKIADFLTSVDDEINKQTEILDQLKLQKQSLMQKLLTGQVRTKI